MYKKLKSMVMEFIAFFAAAILLWLCWQLFQAKRFTKFKKLIETELKPKVVTEIIKELDETRSELLPNNKYHQQASIYFWTQYKVRVLQVALQKEIIDQQWLKDTGNIRNCQHLFHVEHRFLHQSKNLENEEA